MDILIVSIFIISGIIIGVRTGIALSRLNRKDNDATVTPKLHKVLYSLAIALPVILLPIASLLSILDGSDRAIIVFSAWVLYCVTILATLRQLRKYKIVTSVKLIMLILSLAGVILAAQSHYRIEHNSGACLPIEQTQCGYKKVTNLDMYYEVHGSDKKPPLVILHGQLSTAGMFYQIVPELVKYRRVILVEQQAHGHTKDIDRPLSYSQMAEDTLSLLSQLSIKQADILGYSDGGIVALHMTKQQPAVINSLVLSSTTIDTDGYKPEIRSNVTSLSEQTIPQIVKNNYLLVAPDPEGFKILIKKSNEMNSRETGITFDQVKYMNVRKSMVISSSNDIMQKSHTDKLANALASKKVQVSGDHASYIIGDASEFVDILKDFYSK